MKYWICRKCHSIHKKTTTTCECGMLLEAELLVGGSQWVQFPTQAGLEAWIDNMRKYMGANFKIGKDLSS